MGALDWLRGARKFLFGLSIGWPFLWVSYLLIDHALDVGADLTATGVAVGAIGGALAGVMGLFIYGNVKEQRNDQ
jgi:hypothetical protein